MFSGKHDNSVLGVANKDYPAASIANSVMYRMIARHVIKRPIRSRPIYKESAERFQRPGQGHVYNLKPELAAKVKEAFFSFAWEGSALLAGIQTYRAAAGEIHSDHVQGALGGGPPDRSGARRVLCLQMMLPLR